MHGNSAIAMGVVSIIGADPLLGAAVVMIAAYAYLAKKREFDGKRVGFGAGMAGVSLLVFASLELPLLIELGIVLVLTELLAPAAVADEEQGDEEDDDEEGDDDAAEEAAFEGATEGLDGGEGGEGRHGSGSWD